MILSCKCYDSGPVQYCRLWGGGHIGLMGREAIFYPHDAKGLVIKYWWRQSVIWRVTFYLPLHLLLPRCEGQSIAMTDVRWLETRIHILVMSFVCVQNMCVILSVIATEYEPKKIRVKIQK